MRYFLLACCLLWQLTIRAQAFYIYKDTIDNFSIGVPETWKYQATPDSPSMKIAGVNVESMTEKRVPDNFNVAMFRHAGLDVDSALQLLQKMTKANRLQGVKDTGTYWVGKDKMRWFEDMHKVADDTICGSYFIVYRGDLVYMITGIARYSRYEQSRGLFHQIAQSFELLQPGGPEVLKLSFPAAEKWRRVAVSKNPDGTEKTFLRAGQTTSNWTSQVTLMESSIPPGMNIEDLLQNFRTMETEDKGTHYTLLSKDDHQALFKMEVGSRARSTLTYIVYGRSRVHIAAITFKRPVLAEDVVIKWSEIFKAGKLEAE